MADRKMLDAFGDAAALMVAASSDREGMHAALIRMGTDELVRLAAAAVELGGTLIDRETRAVVEAGSTEPGPVLRYLVSVSRKAADIPAR